jgi:hypothetical protein
MIEHVPESGILKWERERLHGEAARHHRAGLVRGQGERRLLTNLAAVSSRVLLGLGSVLLSAGERMADGRMSSRSATI